jgi:hypothetical protein
VCTSGSKNGMKTECSRLLRDNGVDETTIGETPQPTGDGDPSTTSDVEHARAVFEGFLVPRSSAISKQTAKVLQLLEVKKEYELRNESD